MNRCQKLSSLLKEILGIIFGENFLRTFLQFLKWSTPIFRTPPYTPEEKVNKGLENQLPPLYQNTLTTALSSGSTGIFDAKVGYLKYNSQNDIENQNTFFDYDLFLLWITYTKLLLYFNRVFACRVRIISFILFTFDWAVLSRIFFLKNWIILKIHYNFFLKQQLQRLEWNYWNYLGWYFTWKACKR